MTHNTPDPLRDIGWIFEEMARAVENNDGIFPGEGLHPADASLVTRELRYLAERYRGLSAMTPFTDG